MQASLATPVPWGNRALRDKIAAMRTAVFIVICALAVTPLQAASRFSGVVVDSSGAPVPNATVVIGGRTVTTGDDGRFDVPDGPDGESAVQVSASGFASTTVRLTGGAEDVRLVLQPAPLLEAVVVTASRGAERLSTASSATVVTSAELLNSAGGALDDILRNTPGFSLFRRSSSRVSNPTTQGVTLRGVSGSGASRTMVLADGLPLNDPFGSWVYWNRVPEAAIERVEILRGATGDLYGADALGGVVQVLTFAPDRNRLRFSAEGGSHSTGRGSVFGSTRRGLWEVLGSVEAQRTDGVIVVAEEARGAVDVPADSDYVTGFFGGGYAPGPWHASFRINLYDENRNNGTPVTVNTTDWTQFSGEAGGGVGEGAWLVRASAGSQEYYQTFSAVAAGRNSERLTRKQTMPSDFSTLSGQWTRGFGSSMLLVGGEARRTSSEVDETNYAANGTITEPPQSGGVEKNGAFFGRVSLAPTDALTVVVGGRADFWRSAPRIDTLPEHSANFFSPRASASYTLTNEASLHASVYRGYRTPTLNELHRGFSVGNIITNPNPELDPEKLTGFEGGVLLTRGVTSARLTAFWNELDDAVTNVTVSNPGVTPIIRQRQNTDSVRAKGVELEADFRPFRNWTFSGLAVLTRSHFADAPAQPQLEGNRTPQVPEWQLGTSVTYVDPRGFTGSVQVRGFGSQFDDDLNVFKLDAYGVVDLSLSQELRRGINVFLAVENLFDEDYDTGRTPIRTIGWPRSARMGVRLFLP
jgi:outer membrane receptor protein involved in Fe transport